MNLSERIESKVVPWIPWFALYSWNLSERIESYRCMPRVLNFIGMNLSERIERDRVEAEILEKMMRESQREN